jgi:hypothetical protein
MATRSSFFSVLFLVAIPLLGAKGGCGGEVSLGDDACPTSACGGMPELACWDGSSPFTGKCLSKTDGTCGWEPRKCPDMPADGGSLDGGPFDGGPFDGGPFDGDPSDGDIFDGPFDAELDGPLDGGPADTGSACENVTTLPRTCGSKAECTFGLHQYNCCGSIALLV